jgi:hypothetical protein
VLHATWGNDYALLPPAFSDAPTAHYFDDTFEFSRYEFHV